MQSKKGGRAPLKQLTKMFDKWGEEIPTTDQKLHILATELWKTRDMFEDELRKDQMAVDYQVKMKTDHYNTKLDLI